MATQVGIRELRDNLTALMRRVRGGETIEVTHHGKPIAVISPSEDDPVARLIALGEATAAVPLERPIVRGRPRRPGGGSRALQEDRDGR